MSADKTAVPAIAKPTSAPEWMIRSIIHLHPIENGRPDSPGNWTGFLIESLLPRLGVDRHLARQHLDLLEREGIVTIQKAPNPRSPDRPTSTVRLNQQNPLVKDTIQHAETLRAGFLPVELPYGEQPDDSIRRDREPNRGEVIDIPKASPVGSKRAIIWNAFFNLHGKPYILDRRTDEVWARIKTAVRENLFEAELDPISRPDYKSLGYHDLTDDPVFDITLYDHGLAQVTWDLRALNYHCITDKEAGRGVGIEKVKGDVIWFEGIKEITSRVWQAIRSIPSDKTTDISANVYLTLRGARGTAATPDIKALCSNRNINLKISEYTEKPISIVDAIGIHKENIPSHAIEGCLDRIAEYYGWWDHRNPPRRD